VVKSRDLPSYGLWEGRRSISTQFTRCPFYIMYSMSFRDSVSMSATAKYLDYRESRPEGFSAIPKIA